MNDKQRNEGGSEKLQEIEVEKLEKVTGGWYDDGGWGGGYDSWSYMPGGGWGGGWGGSWCW
ncbi:MAG TPA: hypothetical protein VIG06_06110 [Kofleriaceae bacterium]|jgi:uncharacterized membrane protein